MSVPDEVENGDILRSMSDASSMGRFIRESRLEQGLSLGQLAATLSRSPSSVRRWERDEVAPALALMPQLAAALDVDVSALEERRPTAIEPDQGQEDDSADKTISTVEQPVVASQETPLTPEPPPLANRSVGFVGEMWNSVFAEKESWIGWVRGIATALVLVLFVFVLIWAGGEFVNAISDVWHSFGSDGSTSP
jgi:transcriptional regulator with XRE-family HTH domain